MSSSNKAKISEKGAEALRLMLINGQWERSSSGATHEIRNPSTGGLAGTVTWGDRSDALRALEAAQQAFPNWRRSTVYERGNLLQETSMLLLERCDHIASAICSENGKPIDQATAEVKNAAQKLSFFGEECKRITVEVLPSRRITKRHCVFRRPIGVAAVITPWNNPVNSLCFWLGAGLGAGCTIVAKPSTGAPLSPLEIARCFVDAGVPRGVLNMVIGDSTEVGEELIANPISRKIAFIGSEETGKRIMRKAAEHLKRVTLELGGHAPVIIFNDVDPSRAADKVMDMAFKNTGQNCLSVNRILVQKGVHDKFIEELTAKVKKLRVDLSHLKGVEIGPLANKAQLEKVRAHVEDALAHGAKLLYGGKCPEEKTLQNGYYYLPTVLDGITQTMRIANEETFGPVAPVMTFGDLNEAVDIANSTKYGLAAYVLSGDVDRAWDVAEQLEFGVIGINDLQPMIVEAPMSGWKQSGIGVKGSKYGLNEFLDLQYVGVDLQKP